MFEWFAQQVRELVVPADCDALAELLAARDLLDAQITEVLAEIDRFELFDGDGATSTTAWLKDRGGMSRRDAARTTALARRLRELPVTAQAWRDGELTGGQVGSIVGVLDARNAAAFAHHEAAIVPARRDLTAHETGFVMREWKARAEATARDDDTALRSAEPAASTVHLSSTLDGRWALDGDLTPEGGAVVATAVRLAGTDDVEGERRAHRRRDGPTRWSTCAVSSSTTSSTNEAGDTGRTSASSSTSTTSAPVAAGA